jgi:hypothetical protein
VSDDEKAEIARRARQEERILRDERDLGGTRSPEEWDRLVARRKAASAVRDAYWHSKDPFFNPPQTASSQREATDKLQQDENPLDIR